MSKLYLLLMRVIDLLAQKNDDWIRMAKSFKITDDQANEIVQEMYLRINDYVKDAKKIMFDDKQVNTFYVYITLRNIYYSNFYNTGKNIKNRKVIYFSEIVDNDDARKLAKYMIEDPEEAQYNIDKKIKLDNLIDKIEEEIDTWYWYDKKMTKLYMNTKMSMRDISKETKISLSSIFNTLTNAKEKIREVSEKEYREYKK
jgi:DNA-directed RNA polymerase specialized sigma24 family protein